jgi:hypothetical protein
MALEPIFLELYELFQMYILRRTKHEHIDSKLQGYYVDCYLQREVILNSSCPKVQLKIVVSVFCVVYRIYTEISFYTRVANRRDWS